MKKTMKALKIPAIILLLVALFIACDKDFSTLEDSNVLGSDNANFSTDNTTLPIVSYNKKLDSVQINNLPSNLLGVYNDPEFGLSTASILTQITPTTFNPDFGKNPVINSVVLNIPYFSRITGLDMNGNNEYVLDSVYGKKPFKLSIYQNKYLLRDFPDLDSDSQQQNFYSNANTGNTTNNLILTDNLSINLDSNDLLGALIFEKTDFTPSNLPIVIKTGEGDNEVETRLSPALREELDKGFWKNTIIDKQGSSGLINANLFYDYFRSLYFKAEGNDGSMILLNFGSPDANITINYTTGEDDDRTETSYVFNFNGNRINPFINNYNKQLEDGDKNNGDEKLNLKGGSSMAVVDLFPTDADLKYFLDKFRKRDSNSDDGYQRNETTGDFILNKLINEAHLVIYEDDEINTGGDTDFHLYDRIYAYNLENNAPTIDFFADPTENTASPKDSRIISLGQRDPDSRSYKIRLTQHLNDILLRGTESINTKIGLVISNNVNLSNNSQILNSGDDVTAVPSASVLSPRGTVIHGSNSDSDKKMTLKLFFTEIKE